MVALVSPQAERESEREREKRGYYRSFGTTRENRICLWHVPAAPLVRGDSWRKGNSLAD